MYNAGGSQIVVASTTSPYRATCESHGLASQVWRPFVWAEVEGAR